MPGFKEEPSKENSLGMDRPKKVAGVLLAAGASSRMGKPKQLLPAGGLTLLERILYQALRSNLDRVILVLGHRAEDITRALGEGPLHDKLKVVENSEYKRGISSSIIAGLITLEKGYDHVMFLLGDMPFVDSDLINLLICRYLASRLPIGAIEIGTRRSHPVIFSRNLYHELHDLKGDVGARSLFRKYNDKVCMVRPGESFDNTDIDTPEDYVRFQKSLRNRQP